MRSVDRRIVRREITPQTRAEAKGQAHARRARRDKKLYTTQKQRVTWWSTTQASIGFRVLTSMLTQQTHVCVCVCVSWCCVAPPQTAKRKLVVTRGKITAGQQEDETLIALLLLLCCTAQTVRHHVVWHKRPNLLQRRPKCSTECNKKRGRGVCSADGPSAGTRTLDRSRRQGWARTTSSQFMILVHTYYRCVGRDISFGAAG